MNLISHILKLGRIVKIKGEKVLSDKFHRMNLPDPVNEILGDCCARINFLEEELKKLKKENKAKGSSKRKSKELKE